MHAGYAGLCREDWRVPLFCVGQKASAGGGVCLLPDLNRIRRLGVFLSTVSVAGAAERHRPNDFRRLPSASTWLGWVDAVGSRISVWYKVGAGTADGAQRSGANTHGRHRVGGGVSGEREAIVIRGHGRGSLWAVARFVAAASAASMASISRNRSRRRGASGLRSSPRTTSNRGWRGM